MESLYDWLQTIILSTVTAAVGYFTGKKRSDAETESVVVTNYNNLIQQYGSFKESLLQEMERLKKIVEDQEEIISSQRRLLREANEEIINLQLTIKDLQKN